MYVGLLTPIENVIARITMISTRNVTNSTCTLCTPNHQIILRYAAASQKAPSRDKITNYHFLVDIWYPVSISISRKLHGATDLVHGILCEGIASPIYVMLLSIHFDGHCQIMGYIVLNPRKNI